MKNLAALGAAFLALPFAVLAAPIFALWLALQKRARRKSPYRELLPATARSIERCAQAWIPEEGLRTISPGDVAEQIDRYLAGFRSPRKWRMQALFLALEAAPLLAGRAPFSRLDVSARRRFCEEKLATAHGVFGALGRGRQLVRLGYYACEEARLRTGAVLP